MTKTVQQIKEEVDITYAQIERRPENRKKRERKKVSTLSKNSFDKKNSVFTILFFD